MTGFGRILVDDYGDAIDGAGQDYLRRIQEAGKRMGAMIDDLLDLSRLARQEMRHEEVNLSALAWGVAEGISVAGDAGLLRVVLENLLENAWKFTSKEPGALIEFGEAEREGRPAYHVSDNGVGFDGAYAEGIFDPFQRLHAEDELGGTGVGLATVARIVRRHGGSLWAEGQVGRGATFYFTL